MSAKVKVLDNGITLICEHIRGCKLGTLAIGVKVGSCDEIDPLKYGISHVLEHMFYKSTKNYTSEQLNEIFDYAGADTNACTSNEETKYYFTSKMSDFERLSNVFFEMFNNTDYIEEELEKEKTVIKQEILMYADEPEALVNEAHFCNNLFRDSMFNHNTIGTEETVNNITVVDLKAYKETMYTPDRIFISASGGVTMEQLEETVRNLYKVNTNKSCYNRKYIHPKFNKNIRETSTVSSTYVLWSFGDISRKGKDAYKMSLLSSIFSEGMSSRLCKRVREDLGLVYVISSDCQFYSSRGIGGVFTICDEDKVEQIEQEMLTILRDLGNGKFSEEELEKAKNLHEVALIQKSMSGKNDCAMRNLNAYMNFGRLSNESKHYKKIQSITKQDLIAFINKYFNEKHFCRTVLAPEA